MYASRLVIRNYRSIKFLDIVFSKGKNVIVGRNNTGKSNIIKALDLILGESSPTYYKYENITDSDFYSWKEKSKDGTINIKTADEIVIFCELSRDKNEKLNYKEINKCTGFYRLAENVNYSGRYRTYNDKRVRLDFSKDNVFTELFNIYNLNDSQFDKKTRTIWIDSKLRFQVNFQTEFDNKFKFAFVFRALRKEDQIEKDIRFLYREGESQDWFLGFTAPIRNEFLQSAIIPSFRDPSTQLRLNTWSWYGKLMRHLTTKHVKASELLEAFNQVRKIGDEIFLKAKEDVKAGALEVAFPGTEIYFQFNPEMKADIYKSTIIYIDDGFKSPLVDKGSGIQSATIIGLFNYYTKHVNTKTSALLCIEEPELYLHPHARRVISDRLDDFLDNNKNQVIISTHSTEFIRTTKEDLNIIFVVKNEIAGTIAKPIQIREYKHLLLDNNQNELFFADKVIICEGYENYIIKWIAQEKFTKHLDEQNVSVVSAGGKDKISSLTKLVTGIGIDCYIVADFDYFLRDKGKEADKYKTNGVKKHESILSLTNDFFEQNCILGRKGNDIFKKIQKLRADIKKNHEREFYLAKSLDDFKQIRYANFKDLNELLKTLRIAGVCILTRQIEAFSKDSTFLSPENKLDLNKIFDISQRIESGEKISSILDTSEIEEFLSKIIKD